MARLLLNIKTAIFIKRTGMEISAIDPIQFNKASVLANGARPSEGSSFSTDLDSVMSGSGDKAGRPSGTADGLKEPGKPEGEVARPEEDNFDSHGLAVDVNPFVIFPQYVPSPGIEAENEMPEENPAIELSGDKAMKTEEGLEGLEHAAIALEKEIETGIAVIKEILGPEDEARVEDDIDIKARETQGDKGAEGIGREFKTGIEGLFGSESVPNEKDINGIEKSKGDAGGEPHDIACSIGQRRSFEAGNGGQWNEDRAGHQKDAQAAVPAQDVKANFEVAGKAEAKVNYHEIYEKFKEGVKIGIAREGGSVRLSLHPEHLGEMQIRLSIEDKVVKAEVLVESAAVKEALSADSGRLKEIFIQNGLTLEKFSIGLNGSPERGGSFETNGRERPFENQTGAFKEGKRAEEERPQASRGIASALVDIFI